MFARLAFFDNLSTYCRILNIKILYLMRCVLHSYMYILEWSVPSSTLAFSLQESISTYLVYFYRETTIQYVLFLSFVRFVT